MRRFVLLVSLCLLALPVRAGPLIQMLTLVVQSDRTLIMCGGEVSRERLPGAIRDVLVERRRDGVTILRLAIRLEADPAVPEDFLESLRNELRGAGAPVVETVRISHPAPRVFLIHLRVTKDGDHQLKVRGSGWGSFDLREKVLVRILEAEKRRDPKVRVFLEATGDVSHKVVVRALDAVMTVGIEDVRFRPDLK